MYDCNAQNGHILIAYQFRAFNALVISCGHDTLVTIHFNLKDFINSLLSFNHLKSKIYKLLCVASHWNVQVNCHTKHYVVIKRKL